MTGSIIVVGGGFAGVYAALAAARTAGDAANVTLLSREPRLVMRPRLFEADPETLHAELPALLETTGVAFVQGEAEALDLPARAIRLASGRTLPFDRLVVATGSVMRRPAIPGAEAAFSIDTQADAIAFDQRLAACAGRPEPTIVVVGAGFTGVELALNLRDRLIRHAGPAAGERARILLIDQAREVGPELGAGPRPAIEAALAAARVDLRLDVQLAALSASEVRLADGEVIAANAVVLCTGLHAAPFLRNLPGARDALGRIRVDSHLGIPDAPGIFVAGDAAWAATEPGHSTLMSCQHAMPLGKVAGENAARSLLGRELLDYAQPRYVTCLDLGRSGAVLTAGWERQVQATGEEAKALKRQINTRLIYPPSGSREEILRASIPA
jgi:NADH dehydrogenase